MPEKQNENKTKTEMKWVMAVLSLKQGRILYSYLAEASEAFPRVFPVIHSLLDGRINSVLALCHDQVNKSTICTQLVFVFIFPLHCLFCDVHLLDGEISCELGRAFLPIWLKTSMYGYPQRQFLSLFTRWFWVLCKRSSEIWLPPALRWTTINSNNSSPTCR